MLRRLIARWFPTALRTDARARRDAARQQAANADLCAAIAEVARFHNVPVSGNARTRAAEHAAASDTAATSAADSTVAAA
ncbi:MAG: hypothetical protein AAF460_18550, partial [Pseudomonadota bacterium]